MLLSSRAGQRRHAAGGGCRCVPPGLVTWRPWLEDRVLRQMQDLPSEAFGMLVRTLARICDDPYDPVFSVPVPPVLHARQRQAAEPLLYAGLW